jgi:hypothetical protein
MSRQIADLRVSIQLLSGLCRMAPATRYHISVPLRTGLFLQLVEIAQTATPCHSGCDFSSPRWLQLPTLGWRQLVDLGTSFPSSFHRASISLSPS